MLYRPEEKTKPKSQNVELNLLQLKRFAKRPNQQFRCIAAKYKYSGAGIMEFRKLLDSLSKDSDVSVLKEVAGNVLAPKVAHARLIQKKQLACVRKIVALFTKYKTILVCLSEDTDEQVRDVAKTRLGRLEKLRKKGTS